MKNKEVYLGYGMRMSGNKTWESHKWVKKKEAKENVGREEEEGCSIPTEYNCKSHLLISAREYSPWGKKWDSLNFIYTNRTLIVGVP